VSTPEAADVPALSINEVDGGVHNLSRSDTETSSCTLWPRSDTGTLSCTLSPEVDRHGSGNTVVRSSGSVCAGVAVTVLAFFLFFLGLLTSDKASPFS